MGVCLGVQSGNETSHNLLSYSYSISTAFQFLSPSPYHHHHFYKVVYALAPNRISDVLYDVPTFHASAISSRHPVCT